MNYYYFSALFLLLILLLTGCSTPPSNTIPDYTATRLKVNKGTTQTAAEEARLSVIKIKKIKKELDLLSTQLLEHQKKVALSRAMLAK